MKNYLIVILLLLTCKIFAQNDMKSTFQKGRYELAVSYYKKQDFKNALELFSVAYKIKPENEFGKESFQKIDTLKNILRKDMIKNAVGTWKLLGDKPSWAVHTDNKDKNKKTEELVVINEKQILFYEVDIATKIKKLTKSEDLNYYNKDESDALFSAIILSDGSIWSCSLDGTSNQLHVINIANKNENGVEKVKENNKEQFYSKVVDIKL